MPTTHILYSEYKSKLRDAVCRGRKIREEMKDETTLKSIDIFADEKQLSLREKGKKC